MLSEYTDGLSISVVGYSGGGGGDGVSSCSALSVSATLPTPEVGMNGRAGTRRALLQPIPIFSRPIG